MDKPEIQKFYRFYDVQDWLKDNNYNVNLSKIYPNQHEPILITSDDLYPDNHDMTDNERAAIKFALENLYTNEPYNYNDDDGHKIYYEFEIRGE